MPSYEFDAPLWRWQARAQDVWTFVSLPEAVSDEVLELGEPYARGFGSLRVEVTVGGSVWRTSIFPDHGRRAYVLPVKRAAQAKASVWTLAELICLSGLKRRPE